MLVNKEVVTHVARLANLELTGDEVAYYETRLAEILDYVAQLGRLPDDLGPDWRADTRGTPTPERPDVPVPPLSPEEALANAPARHGTAFLVPRIIE